MLGGVKMGLGLMSKLGRAWVGTWVGGGCGDVVGDVGGWGKCSVIQPGF